MKYEIDEIFYSLKGEGVWTGTPMLFIRLHGCNLNCKFCDTPVRMTARMTVKEILDELKHLNTRCKHVVITGGEPTCQDLDELVSTLHVNGYYVHLETNGTNSVESLNLNWVAVSPKGINLNKYTVEHAQEIKFLYGRPYSDWEWLIRRVSVVYNISEVKLLLMPLARPRRDDVKGEIIQEHVDACIKYCKENPEFNLCMQMHKIWGIP